MRGDHVPRVVCWQYVGGVLPPPLQTADGGEKNIPFSHPDRRWTWSVARGVLGAGGDWGYAAATRVNRKARGDHLCLWAGERASGAGSAVSRTPPDAEDSRRESPFCRDLSPQAAADARSR